MTELQDSAQTTESLDQPEVVETSPNEEAQDTDELDIEDIEVSLDELEDTEESDDTEEDKAVTESEAEETEESAGDEDTETKEDNTPSEEERKRLNDEYAKQRIAEREARQQAKQQQQQEYLQSAEDARDLAVRQLQVDAYNNRVTTNTSMLESGIDRAIADIDLFRTGSPEVKEELAASLEVFEQLYVTRDANGDPVEVKADVNQYLQSQAARIRKLTGVGARSESTAKQKAKARTDSLPTRAPKEKAVDADVADFDSEFNR